MQDLKTCTRSAAGILPIHRRVLKMDDLDLSRIKPEVAQYLADMYLNHRFDLLGSGWVENSYDGRAPGLEGYRYSMNLEIDRFDPEGFWLRQILLPPHLESGRKIWQGVSDAYTPIDWQKDYKSGYRWSARRWYKDQSGDLPGVDIKVPWELARMQHLPQMALFCAILPEFREELLKEFCNQVLDFIATNPPRMGVNWVCTMDVAIRAANILLAYDLFRQLDEGGEVIDCRFRQVVSNAVYEHGVHIVNNLEWSEKLANNHYLANIVGLLFVAVYLDRSDDIDRWLAFSVQEIISEVKRQFYCDGGNFESSTSYHRLGTEMAAFATALVLGLDDDKKRALRDYDCDQWSRWPRLKTPDEQEYNVDLKALFPDWYIERLYRAGRLTLDLTKPTGEVPQIGDNDSGRLFRLSPNGSFMSTDHAKGKYRNLAQYTGREIRAWDENCINHQTLLSAISGLFDSFEPDRFRDRFLLERSVIRNIAGGKCFSVNFRSDCELTSTSTNAMTQMQTLSHRQEGILRPSRQGTIPLTSDLKLYGYPDSGFFIFASKRIHMTICAAPNGQNGLGGHAHNDKLSFELNLDGEDIVVDPGTYLYTPLVDWRNRFRSVRAHNTVVVAGQEQNRWTPGRRGLFSLNDETAIEVLDLSETGIVLQLTYRDIIHIRQFEIACDYVRICDYANHAFEVNLNPGEMYSGGYGKIVRGFR
ncbi:MAG: alginate lyase family protein [Candidatus Zixiibacteriota bacterium]|nr:MAG: alginate lyase family protein [candidate division Zixibacteria bacterium]